MCGRVSYSERSAENSLVSVILKTSCTKQIQKPSCI